MSTEDKILDMLKSKTDPMSAGQLADATGIDRKAIDKAMNTLKKEGKIVSPKRCYWTAG